MSNVDVSTIRKYAERIRWCWVLPVTMVAVTGILLVLAAFEYAAPNPMGGCDACGDMQPPAMIVAMFMNGPAFLIGEGELLPVVHLFGEDIYGLGRLLPAFAFWSLVGLAIDRGMKGKTVLRSRWLRSRLSLLGLLSCLVLAWWFISSIGQWAFDPRIAIHMLGLIGLWVADLSKVVELPWCLLGIVYFSRKLWRMYRSRPAGGQLTVAN